MGRQRIGLSFPQDLFPKHPRRVALGFGIIGRILGKILWLQYCFPQAFVYKELHSLHMQKILWGCLTFQLVFLTKGMTDPRYLLCFLDLDSPILCILPKQKRLPYV